MPHPNLSPRLNALVDSQVSYTDLVLGDRLEIQAIDARKGALGTFKVQVVGFKEDHTPIFAGGGRFAPFGDDRRTPMVIRRGTFMSGGFSAYHVPEFVLSMVFLGGIGIGRDYSLEYVGGEERFAYLCRIAAIKRRPPPRGWQAPQDAVAEYLKQVARTVKQAQLAEERRQERLKRAMRVFTANSVYELAAEDAGGQRTISKQGEDWVKSGRLIRLHHGHSMCFDVSGGITMSSSPVVKIEPDPDAQD